jgi:hypothetical protein
MEGRMALVVYEDIDVDLTGEVVRGDFAEKTQYGCRIVVLANYC